MPQSKEEKAIYMKEYRVKNKEKWAAYNKDYYAKNKDKRTAHQKKYATNNKDKIAAYIKSPAGIKSYKISRWKRIGIIYDLEKLHYLYMNTHRCWVCKNKFKSSRDKQADHDHDINNGENFRFILCKSCNNHDSWHKHIAANRIIKLFKCL